ncbi:PREDICTED: matrix extracellular phosphoglycoprotein [Condylura cristata]|uniref:matrix extracellular phosphoglycoprotein n=1 Tax=Condylura cristata TaxID=143302 RepID=UPI0006436678|nr:PREDICTED: matrix extracellular phosphoglycoprotein [Condylura cristata]
MTEESQNPVWRDPPGAIVTNTVAESKRFLESYCKEVQEFESYSGRLVFMWSFLKMHLVCFGLLLLGLAWAAPQERRSKDNIVLHQFNKRRIQGPTPEEPIVQKDVSLFGVNENNQSGKYPHLFASRQTMNEGGSISNEDNPYNDLATSTHPEPTEDAGVEERDEALSTLHDQEEYGAAFIRYNIQHRIESVTVTEPLREENKEKKPHNIVSKILADANYVKAPLKDKKNHQRDPQSQDNPVKSQSTHHSQHNVDYLKQLPKVKKIPRDFEGSSYPEFHGRGDNDISPFSGDGQPFKDIFGKGETDLDGTDTQTEFSGSNAPETNNLDMRGPGYNELPEKEENGRNSIRIKDKTEEDANTAEISLVEGNNDIIGITNFKELPGKEGNRVDGNSQNAHEGQVEFHYPHAPSKENRKEGGGDITKSTHDNEIQKKGKDSSRKGIENSSKNQETSSENQSFPSKGKSQELIPSHSLDNEIKNEIHFHNDPNIEGTTTTHKGKGHYVPHRPNTSTGTAGVPQRKGSWGHRKPYSNRKPHFPRKHDSSESSESDSSSESEGD